MKKTLTLVVATLASAAFLMAQQDAKPKDAVAGDAEKGKETFEQCGACHNTDTDEKKMGPSLKGLYKKDKLHNGKAVTDANVKAVIDKGGNGMPPYEELLSAEEKANVIAYLKTL
jgi:cytochrome c